MAWRPSDDHLANGITSYDELVPEFADFLKWFLVSANLPEPTEASYVEIAWAYITEQKDI